jgi:hypothetical protein
VLEVVIENYNRRDHLMWIDDGEKKPNVVRGVFPGFIFVKLPHPVSFQVREASILKSFFRMARKRATWVIHSQNLSTNTSKTALCGRRAMRVCSVRWLIAP